MTHDHETHGPESHGPDAHGPDAHGPDTHGPDTHGPGAHGPEQGSRFVCSRCKKSSPALDEPPFLTDLGRQIQEKICRPCWEEWMATSIMVINEYRLNLMAPEAAAIYDAHMCEFLGLKCPA